MATFVRGFLLQWRDRAEPGHVGDELVYLPPRLLDLARNQLGTPILVISHEVELPGCLGLRADLRLRPVVRVDQPCEGADRDDRLKPEVDFPRACDPAIYPQDLLFCLGHIRGEESGRLVHISRFDRTHEPVRIEFAHAVEVFPDEPFWLRGSQKEGNQLEKRFAANLFLSCPSISTNKKSPAPFFE
ncbi:hypothetical protein [uncultured Paracoccus sp.]|uniref:hypothetical protein n=1 Tax=uncultured Paracoccus sp. TaxID=189685 RepID=UPI0026039935|nr:hypothetical protein [uncultured Paracoccus sp.]